jgi:hypothetical protein
MPPKKPMKFRVDDAVFCPWPQNPNFSGKPTLFKDAGHRSFNVIIDKDSADKLAIDGWPVKCQLQDEKHPDPFCFIEIIVKYKDRQGKPVVPPRIVLHSSKGETEITEETVDSLDMIRIKQLDFIATSYEYNVNGKTGITAYLQTAHIIVDEDELDLKYAKMKNPVAADE